MTIAFQQTVNPCSRCMFGYSNLTQRILDNLYPDKKFTNFPGAVECQNGDNYQNPIKHFSDTCESFMLNDINAEDIIKL